MDCLPPHLPSSFSLYSPRDGLHFCCKSDKLGPILLSVFLLHSPTIVETVEVIVYPVLYSTVLLKVREDFQHSGQFSPLENIRPRGHIRGSSVLYSFPIIYTGRASTGWLHWQSQSCSSTTDSKGMYYRTFVIPIHQVLLIATLFIHQYTTIYIIQRAIAFIHQYTATESYSIHSPVYCYRQL